MRAPATTFLILAAACSGPKPTADTSAASDTGAVEAAVAIESQFLGDAGHAGYWGDGGGWAGTQRWSLPVSDDGFIWPPSTSAELVFYQHDATVDARQLSDGAPVWSQPLSSVLDGSGSFTPAVVDGVVYAVAQGGNEAGAPVVTLEALDAETGARLWAVTVSAEVYTTPTVTASSSHAVLWLGELVVVVELALQAEVWRLDSNTLSSPYSPMVLDEQLFVMGWDEASGVVLQGRDLSSGKLHWSAPVNTELATAEAYLRHVSGADGQVYVFDGKDGLVARDALSGAELWSTGPLSFGHFSAHGSLNAAISGDRVAVQDESSLRILDTATGQSLHRISNPVGAQRWLTAAGGAVYFGAAGFDLETGEPVAALGDIEDADYIPAGEALLRLHRSDDNQSILSALE